MFLTQSLIYFETVCNIGVKVNMTNYENEDMDFHYENSGASMSEMQHAEDCDWIYGNCDCGLIESLGDYDVPDDGDY